MTPGLRGVRREGSPLLRTLGTATVCLIVLVLLQCRHERATTHDSAPSASRPATPAGFDLASGLAHLAPRGFAPDGPSQTLDEDALENKIGDLDLFYTDAGLRYAVCQRYSATDGPARRFDACVYVQRDARAAMSTFLSISQAGQFFGRDEGRPSGLARHAWESQGFLSFAQGDAYVEVASEEPAAENNDARHAVAAALAVRYGGKTLESPPFPDQDRMNGRMRLIMRNAFGASGLNGIYACDYKAGENEAIAFWSDRDSADEAEAMARLWRDFLLANGAVSVGETIADASVLSLMGFIEVVCTRGRVVAGVHQAESLDLARRLAAAVCASPGA